MRNNVRVQRMVAGGVHTQSDYEISLIDGM